MRLDVTIIEYEIRKAFDLLYIDCADEDLKLKSPFLYFSRVSQEGRIYVLPYGESLPVNIPSKSLIVCCRDAGAQLKGRHKAAKGSGESYPIMVTDAGSTSDLMNAIQEIYDKYDYWVKGLNDILTEGRNTLQRILNFSAKVHENMFLVQDAGFKTVGVAWSGDFAASKPWNTDLLKSSLGKQMASGVLDQIMRYFPDRRMTKHAMHHSITDIETIDIPLYDGSIYQGMLSMVQYNRDFDKQDFAIVEFLGGYVSHVLSIEARFRETEPGKLSDLFWQLLDAKYVEPERIETICANVGFQPQDRFVVVAIQFQTGNATAYIKYIQQEIIAEIDGSTCCNKDDFLAVIIDVSLHSNSDGAWLDTIQRCIAEFDLRAGISDEFTGFQRCASYFCEASETLSLVPLERGPGVYWFRDVRLGYAIRNSVGDLKPEMMYTEGFKRLLEYEKKAAVSYIETLQVLLEENLSISGTARRLYISRNTFLARYERLQAVLQEDLEDPDVRFGLELSLRLYRSYNAGTLT